MIKTEENINVMFKKEKKYYIITLILVLSAIISFAQPVLYNNGSIIYFSNGAIAQINGDTENFTGKFINNGNVYLNGNFTFSDSVYGTGYYHLYGNWINNGVFVPLTSQVILEGSSQTIKGNNETYFYDLELSGSGIKNLEKNSYVQNILNLNHLEFATDSFILKILNTDAAAIQLTSGFVSSLENGFLVRATSDTFNYLFPVGSSLNNPRYRPVHIKPENSGLNEFAVRFVNNDATIDGYDRTQLDSNLCATIPDFYFMVTRFGGSSNAILQFSYDETNDGFWDNIGNWQISQWNEVSGTTISTGSPFNILTTSTINDFSNYPYIPAISFPQVDIGNDTTLCVSNSLTLDAGPNYDSYLWNTGATTQTIVVYSSGVYSVTVTINGCTATDTIKISEHDLNYTLYGDSSICQNDTAELTISTNASFIWSTGDTDSTINVSPTSTETYYVTIQDTMCSIIDSITVQVSTLNIDAGQNAYICQGDTAMLIASGGTVYVWSTGDLNDTIFVSPADTTTYYVTVTNSNGCSGTDSVTVYVLPPPVANAGSDTSVCEGSTIQLYSTGGTLYHWEPDSLLNDPNIQDPIATILFTTTFTVTVSNGYCSDIDSITVYTLPTPDLEIDNDTSICEEEQITISAYGNGSFIWSTGDTTASITVSPSSTTTYTVTLTSHDYNCSAEEEITITVLPLPQAFAGNDTSICEGESVILHAEGGSSYYWSPQNNIDNPYSQTTIAHPTTTTTYTVTVYNENCYDIDSVLVIVNPIPYVFAGNDTTIEAGSNLQLNVITNANSPSFLWSPNVYLSQNDIANPITTPSTTITYIVTVTDINGCSNNDTIVISVNEPQETQLIIYNTFTPNGDGINDTWYIEGIEMYPDNYLIIYNRDGMKVYEKQGYNNTWDGKYYGNDLPAATYYYVLDLGNNTEPLKGHVTIIR